MHVHSGLHEGSLTAASTGTEVDYKVLTPPGWHKGERLPLVLHLHGAISSSASLELARPWYEHEWARGALQRCLVGCASTPTVGGFYLDQQGGPSWGTLVDREFPRHLERAFGATPGQRAILGTSMGGLGALRLGFGRPGAYTVIVAVSPAIFPGEHPDEVPAANRRDVLGDLHSQMGADDPERYVANSVYGPLRANAENLRRRRPAILIDSGGADEFGLADGAEYLHRLMWDLGVAHDYRLVAASGHLGSEAEQRQADAVTFLARALRDQHQRGECQAVPRIGVMDHGGTGPDMVLCHGANRTQSDWEPLIERLGDRFRIVSYDLRGHGLSDPPPDGSYGWDGQVDDLKRVVRGIGLTRPVVAGHSLGGMIATMYAAAGHPCRAVINLDGLGGGAPSLYPGMDPVTVHQRRHEQAAAYAGTLAPETRPGADFQIAIAQAQDGWSIFDATRRVLCPALIIRSGSRPPLDRLPKEYAELARALLRGIDNELRHLRESLENLRVVTVHEAGHLLHLQAPNQTSDAIRDFLS